jgi:hypothetical protein
MAGSAIVGALRVVLGADTAAFESSLNKAKGSANSFAASITKIAAGIGLEHGLEKAVEGIVHGFKEAIKSADDMGKAAQKVGLPVEELTKLKFAADLSDVSMESLSTGLGKLSKNMAAVATGSKEAKEHFEALGIEVQNDDKTLKSVSQVFAELAGKFAGSADGAAKTATALNLLGKGGKDLIPLLNEGKHGLEEMMKAAENMGLVISKDTANASQKLNDNLKTLMMTKQGLTNLVMEGLLPALVRLSDEFIETAKSGNAVRAMADAIVSSIKQTVSWFTQQAIAAQQTALAVVELGKGLAASLTDFDKAAQHFAEMNRINSETPAKMEAAGAAADAYFLKITVGSQALKDLPLGPNKEEEARLKAVYDDITQRALNLFNSVKTPAEEFAFKQAEINFLFESGAISVETYGRAMEQLAETIKTSMGQSAASIAGSLSEITGTFGKENKALGIASKAFAVSQAIINTYLAATKALATLPPPASYAAAAAAVAAGLAMVVKITAQPGFAGGGSFKVPGGISGTDNVMVPLNLASGERVDITPANEASRNGVTGGVQEITLRTPRMRDIFQDNIRDLVDSLNLAAPDGYKLKFAD